MVFGRDFFWVVLQFGAWMRGPGFKIGLFGNCHAANGVSPEVFPDQFVWIAVGQECATTYGPINMYHQIVKDLWAEFDAQIEEQIKAGTCDEEAEQRMRIEFDANLRERVEAKIDELLKDQRCRMCGEIIGDNRYCDDEGYPYNDDDCCSSCVDKWVEQQRAALGVDQSSE